jgi:hypothetical protein
MSLNIYYVALGRPCFSRIVKKGGFVKQGVLWFWWKELLENDGTCYIDSVDVIASTFLQDLLLSFLTKK